MQPYVVDYSCLKLWILIKYIIKVGNLKGLHLTKIKRIKYYGKRLVPLNKLQAYLMYLLVHGSGNATFYKYGVNRIHVGNMFILIKLLHP